MLRAKRRRRSRTGRVVGPAEVVDDAYPGPPLARVPDALGELQVGEDRRRRPASAGLAQEHVRNGTAAPRATQATSADSMYLGLFGETAVRRSANPLKSLTPDSAQPLPCAHQLSNSAKSGPSPGPSNSLESGHASLPSHRPPSQARISACANVRGFSTKSASVCSSRDS